VDHAGLDYLTIKSACERLGVSPNTLRTWGASGKVQEYRHPMNNTGCIVEWTSRRCECGS